MIKKVVILGTNNGVQKFDYQQSGQFREVLACLLESHDVQVILEETDWYTETVGNKLARERNLPWESVRTPDTPDFGPTCEVESGMRVAMVAFGPIHKQTNRERVMQNRIAEFMAGYSRGLFVCGLGHIQSMSEKLSSSGFDVEAYEWQKPVGSP
jgi:hypothetical protein